ncbi:uridylyltransferase [Haemophilus influenzae]|uniref:Uridylyltransferase n=1 Tax=Haemophilus influenzae TaxID=727 RepID=A0A2X1PHN7_HAEIF|nr:uridylyltransferase [Haemophilus influenzae]
MDGVRCFLWSDLDFLILVEQTPSPEIEEKITQFYQFLLGLRF